MIIKEIITQFTPENLLALLTRLQAEGKIYPGGIDVKFIQSRYESSRALVIEIFWEIIIRNFLVKINQNESDYYQMAFLIKEEKHEEMIDWINTKKIGLKDSLVALGDAYRLAESLKDEAEKINGESNQTKGSNDLFYFVSHHAGHEVFAKRMSFVSYYRHYCK